MTSVIVTPLRAFVTHRRRDILMSRTRSLDDSLTFSYFYPRHRVFSTSPLLVRVNNRNRSVEPGWRLPPIARFRLDSAYRRARSHFSLSLSLSRFPLDDPKELHYFYLLRRLSSTRNRHIRPFPTRFLPFGRGRASPSSIPRGGEKWRGSKGKFKSTRRELSRRPSRRTCNDALARCLSPSVRPPKRRG